MKKKKERVKVLDKINEKKLESKSKNTKVEKIEKEENGSSLYSTALKLAWPAVLESFFIDVAGMIDTMMVAGLGPVAVAATGLTLQPKFLAMTPLIAIATALSAIVARRLGERDRKRANSSLSTALAVAIIVTIITTVITLFFTGSIVDLAGANADTHSPAVKYFRIIMAGMICTNITMVINAAQRGSGNTRIAFTTNMISSLVNIVFNYLLIYGKLGFPKMGIEGAALATVLGSLVAMIMSIRSLFRKHSYVKMSYIRRKKLFPSMEIFSSINQLGLPILIENLFMRVGFMTTAVVAASLGTEAFAAHQVNMNLLGLGFSFGNGMQIAAMTLTGESLGSGREDQALRYGKICQRMGIFLAALLSSVIFLTSRSYYGIQFKDTNIIDIGVILSRYVMVIVFFQIQQVIFGGVLRSAGDVRYTLISSTISVTIIRSFTTVLFVNVLNMGLHGIWLGVFCDQISRFLFMFIRFKQGKWTKLKI